MDEYVNERPLPLWLPLSFSPPGSPIQYFFLNFARVWVGGQGSHQQSFNSFYCQSPLFSLQDHTVLEGLETPVLIAVGPREGVRRNSQEVTFQLAVCEHAHTFPALPSPTPLPFQALSFLTV